MLKVTLPDGKILEMPANSTGLQVAEKIGKRLAKDALGVKIDGEVRDLMRPIEKNAKIQILTWKDKEGQDVFRHTTAHILAHAIKNLYPKAKPTIGPPIENGFFYDFDDLEIKETDFPAIEKEMQKIITQNNKLERTNWTLTDVKKTLSNNPYKVELATEFKQKGWDITAYKEGDFIDLCEGPHVPETGYIKAIKLMKLSAAYWKGNQKNKQLTRVYGTSFPTQKDMDEYLKLLEEAEKRDHKKIAHDQELYILNELAGKGLPLWLPKGTIIRQEIENFAIQTETKAGFQRVATPHMAKEELFKTSGHLPHYADSMYPPMIMDDGTYYLKAMNCPLHHLIFKHKQRSYKELPVRLAEYGTVYRNELSGTLSGLLRVRMISMNDAHIYCRKDQIGQEVKAVLEMIKHYFEVFGFKEYGFRLSCWDANNKEKYIDEPENWKFAEEELRKILKELKLPYTEVKNEAAFYGPKIDVQFKTVLGREETLSTVQLDFAAKKRFQLSYADKEGTNDEVFVIHRAPLSSHERFIAFIIEHYAGRLPLWLSPEQVRILTVADRFEKSAQQLVNELNEKGIRAELDNSAESINKKVRNAQIDQVNYIIVYGEKEQNGELQVRTRENKQEIMKTQQFIKTIQKEIETKTQTSTL